MIRGIWLQSGKASKDIAQTGGNPRSQVPESWFLWGLPTPSTEDGVDGEEADQGQSLSFTIDFWHFRHSDV